MCDRCLDDLPRFTVPVSRVVEIDRALSARLVPIAAARGLAVPALACRLLDILSHEPVMIDNLLDEDA